MIPTCIRSSKKNFLLICSASKYGSVGYKINLFCEFDLSIPAFGAIILSDDVITNPETPPNTTSDSLITASLNLSLIENFLDISFAFLDDLIEF